ncbi:MAG TPA: mechanosensitive ion channel domain-containing protein, partial [Acidimicrobiia bacterium]|nr:mechanosensitive ion channel domain-containing protein [Acidimicrobiia bacterium]
MDATAANPWLATAIVVGSGVVLYLILAGIGARFVTRVEERTPGSAARVLTLWVMVRRVTLIVILVLVVLMLIDIWGLNMAPFLAVGTAVAAALGFGAQNLIRDVIAGFFILAEDQYRIGDTVTVAATTGKVEDIQFRVTVLRDGEGNVHYVPNGQITVTSNLTSLYASPSIDVRVGYQADVDRAMDVMLDELMRLSAEAPWSDMITKEPQMLGVQDLVGSGVFLRARLTTAAEQRWSVQREALR